MELWFGAGFKPNVEFHAVAHDFLYNRAHLVNLDRINYEIFRLVAIFLCRGAETV